MSPGDKKLSLLNGAAVSLKETKFSTREKYPQIWSVPLSPPPPSLSLVFLFGFVGCFWLVSAFSTDQEEVSRLGANIIT